MLKTLHHIDKDRVGHRQRAIERELNVGVAHAAQLGRLGDLVIDGELWETGVAPP
jgi:hypothetical protein